MAVHIDARSFAFWQQQHSYIHTHLPRHHHLLQNRDPRHKLIPPLLRRILIRPLQQRIVIHTLMNRTPPRPGGSFAFESRVSRAHQGLADVVEAVGGVVGDFLG